MATKIKPLGDRVLVEQAEEKEVKKVESLSPIPLRKSRDRVMISKYGGTEIKVDGKEYKVLNSDDILAIVG